MLRYPRTDLHSVEGTEAFYAEILVASQISWRCEMVDCRELTLLVEVSENQKEGGLWPLGNGSLPYVTSLREFFF